MQHALVWAEAGARKATLETIAAARTVAGAVSAAVVADSNDDAHVRALAEVADHVWVMAPAFENGLTHEARTSAMQQLMAHAGSELLLMPADRAGQASAARLAARLGGSLLEDVTALRLDGDTLVAERLAYLSRAVVTVAAARGPWVVSVKPGIWSAPAATGKSADVHSFTPTWGALDALVQTGERSVASRGRVALDEAEIVVCGGRGLGSADAFERLAVGLADDLGAGVAATRAVVDAQWRPYEEQVGQTGKSINPKLYIGVAVSGAVQHLSGMNRSGVVVAINKDPDAPILKLADYGVVGDVHEVVPALREALKANG